MWEKSVGARMRGHWRWHRNGRNIRSKDACMVECIDVNLDFLR